MKDIFFSSDHHLGHRNIWEKFKKDDGSPLRDFSSTDEMNETIIDRHNAVVKPSDTVYFLGDVVINKKYLQLVTRMNGKKRLVRGNHDIFDDKYYREAGFEKIYGVRVFVDAFICSHIPLHPDSITNRFRCNIHGHLHGNRVMQGEKLDPRYYSICMEQLYDYTPMHFDDILKVIQIQFDEAGYDPGQNHFNGSSPG